MRVHATSDQRPHAAPSVLDADAGDVQISGLWLVVARAAWIVLFATNLWYAAVAIGRYHAQALHPCAASSCVVTPAQVATLHSVGMSLSRYADLSTEVVIALTLIGALMALAIFVRRSNTRIALAVGILLFTFAIGNLTAGVPITLLAPPVDTALALVNLAIAFSVFMIFPDGRFVPRWTWLLVVAWVVLHWALNAFPTADWLYAFYPGIYLGAIGVQVYRYVRVSNAQRRQQTKIVVLAFVVTLVGNILYWIALPALLPTLRAPGSLYPLVGYLIYLIITLILPISFAVAIQRYRLFDVDVLINRALVYGSLTFILASLEVALIVGAQTLTRILAGPRATQPQVVIVLSTLLIAALFRPLRRRLQSLIDRRFYRRKYDAARTLATFGAALRTEAELHDLTDRLLEVVAETMQPAHVSLWLSPTERGTRNDSTP
jgi:hypothetical protein